MDIENLSEQEIAEIERLATQDSFDNGHALISPSGASRWMKCVGSMIGLHEDRKTSPDNIESVRGTTAHLLLEVSATHRITPFDVTESHVQACPNALDYAFNWYNAIIGKSTNTEELKAWAFECYTHIITGAFPREMRYEVDRVWSNIKSFMNAGYFLYSELSCDLKPLLKHSQCNGSSDIVLFNPTYKHLLIVDLKYGVAIEVLPKRSKQLMIYAGGVLSAFSAYDIDTVDIVIAQPRINNRVWDTWRSSKVEIIEFCRKEVFPASIRALIALGRPDSITDADYKPNVKSCMFCHRKLKCHARLRKFEEEVRNAFASVGSTINPPESYIPKPLPTASDISNDDIVKLFNAAPFIRGFLKDVETIALERVSSGARIEGLKMVEGRNRRYWSTDESTIIELCNVFGVDSDKIYNVKLKSPAQMEKLDIDKSILKSIMSFVANKKSKPVLTVSSDSRKDIKEVRIEAFDSIKVK